MKDLQTTDAESLMTEPSIVSSSPRASDRQESYASPKRRSSIRATRQTLASPQSLSYRLTLCSAAAWLLLALPGYMVRSTVSAQSVATEPPAVQDKVAEPLKLNFHSPSSPITLTQRYRTDRGNLLRFYNIEASTTQWQRLTDFDVHWLIKTREWLNRPWDEIELAQLKQLVDDIENQLRKDHLLQRERREALKLLPFATTIIELCEARQRVDPIDPARLASTLETLRQQIQTQTAGLESNPAGMDSRQSIRTAVAITEQLQRHLAEWHAFYYDYDPLYTWWVSTPYEQADTALKNHGQALQKQLAALQASTPENTPSAAVADTQSADLEEIIRGTTISPATLAELDRIAELAVAQADSRMQAVIEQYRRALQPSRPGGRGGNRGNRTAAAEQPADDTPNTAADRQRQRIELLQNWLAVLEQFDYEQLNQTEQVDYHLLRHRIQSDLKRAQYQLEHPDYELPPVTDSSGISGQPIGKDRLQIELEAEMIPYTPEELVQLAEKEYAWCQREIKKAAREMGFGDDWQAAVEKVKTLHVAPGQQPELIRNLAREAIDYLQKHQLVSVSEIAKETWRMRMMSPERQLVSPFFLGGEVILVSFPTLSMQHNDKLQSLRGNNIHFARATVHHELIPGHHLQGYMNARHRTYRQLFQTPFWLEGWALYWEFRLYDRGFPATPEDRVGFLVWRSHRCARIIFSLNFHLGRMRPQECIDLLVARVGFEPNNAAAEVRRSLGTDYGPLYQAAYMLGGVQFRSLYQEFVTSGKMSETEFHDRILQEHAVPVAMVRAILQGKPLERSGPTVWRFYD